MKAVVVALLSVRSDATKPVTLSLKWTTTGTDVEFVGLVVVVEIVAVGATVSYVNVIVFETEFPSPAKFEAEAAGTETENAPWALGIKLKV